MRRSARRARLATTLTIAAVAAFPAAASADICESLDTGPIPNPAQAACDVVKAGVNAGKDVVQNGPLDAAKDIVTAPIKAAGDAVMKGVTDWVGKGASWLVGQAGHLIDTTTTPRITSPWFMRQYRAMGTLAVVFALPLLLLSVIQGVLRRDGGLIVRSVAVNLPLAFLLTGMAVAAAALLLAVTDAMSSQIASSVGNDAKEFFKDTAKALGALIVSTGGDPVPLFAVFLGALIAALGAFFVWVELLLRSAAIYVAVLFLPLTFVGMIWPQTARWARRLAWLLVALVLAKFVIVAIMALAAAGLGHSRADDAFQGVLAGAALMLLAAFSPVALLRLVPLAESAVESVRHRGGVGAATLAPVASPGLVMRRVLDGNWSGGGGLRAAPASASAGSGAGGSTGRRPGGGPTGGGAASAGTAAAVTVASGLRSQARNGGAAATTAGGASPQQNVARPAGSGPAHGRPHEEASRPSPGGRPSEQSEARNWTRPERPFDAGVPRPRRDPDQGGPKDE